MLVQFTTPSPYDVDMFTSDLNFNSILPDDLQPKAPLDDYTFTLPELSGETYTDLNEGTQVPLDETYSNIEPGKTEPLSDNSATFDNIFNVESNSPDSSLALFDPELQPLVHAPDCNKFKSVLCCNPQKEFVPAAVDECIWCMNPAF